MPSRCVQHVLELDFAAPGPSLLLEGLQLTVELLVADGGSSRLLDGLDCLREGVDAGSRSCGKLDLPFGGGELFLQPGDEGSPTFALRDDDELTRRRVDSGNAARLKLEEMPGLLIDQVPSTEPGR